MDTRVRLAALWTTIMILVAFVGLPTLMSAVSVILPRRVMRPVTLVIAPIFAVTIVGAAVGEMGYYVLASVIELILLVVVVIVARWRAPQA